VKTPIVMAPIGAVRSTLLDPRDAPHQAFEGAPPAILEAIDGTPILDLKVAIGDAADA